MTLSSPQLGRLARSRPARDEPGGETAQRCELCAEAIADEHRHLLDVPGQTLLCVCQACSVLFDDQAAGGRHYRLVSARRMRLDALNLGGTLWAGLDIPVDLAFFVQDSAADRVIAFFPSPTGTLRHAVPAAAWQRITAENPPLAQLRPDVEALVVNRARQPHDHWLLPLDDCYRLTALLRQHWNGFGGGTEVWERIAGFFDGIKEAS